MREEPPTAAPAGREGDAVEVPVPEEVAPDAWHRRVASAVAEGWDVLDLYVCTEQGDLAVVAAARTPSRPWRW